MSGQTEVELVTLFTSIRKKFKGRGHPPAVITKLANADVSYVIKLDTDQTNSIYQFLKTKNQF